MTTEQAWLAGVGTVLLALSLVSLWLATSARRRASSAEDLAASLLQRIEGSTAPPAADGSAQDLPERPAHLITEVGTAVTPEQDAAVVPARIEGRLFSDIVARETVVKTAGLVHGLRRAASPEVRNRVRFEMRQELKRTRRRRRADLKEALRDLRRRQREAEDPSYDDRGTAA